MVTSGLKWIFGVLNRTGMSNECNTFALQHSGVLDVAAGLTVVGHDEAYKAVFESLFFWVSSWIIYRSDSILIFSPQIARPAEDVQRIFDRQPGIQSMCLE